MTKVGVQTVASAATDCEHILLSPDRILSYVTDLQSLLVNTYLTYLSHTVIQPTLRTPIRGYFFEFLNSHKIFDFLIFDFWITGKR